MANSGLGVTQEREDDLDQTSRLPDAGDNELLDALCERKNITVDDLRRIGARCDTAQPHVLQIWWPDGVRYRDLITDRRWIDPTSDFSKPKVVWSVKQDHSKLVVVEGETDAARMAGLGGPGYDVLIMGGASPSKDWWEPWLEETKDYEQVFVATDTDQAGEHSAKLWLKYLGDRGIRWLAPGDGDWCALDTIPPTPEAPKPPPMWVAGEALFELEYPDDPSYLEHNMLPTTGLLVLHGWKGSYKSWLAFDLMLALATGGRWAEFETIEPNLKVGIIQFEVPPYHYKDRMLTLAGALGHEERARFANLHHFSPLALPQWNVSDENKMDAFVEMATKEEFDVLLFDPIRQMVGVASMNDQEAQQHIVQFFRHLNREGISVVCTHHDSKTSARTGGGSMLDMTAGDVLVGAADSVVSVQLPKGDTHEQSRRRNLRFFVRNAPPLGGRGFEMEDQLLHYRDTVWGGEDVDDEPAI